MSARRDEIFAVEEVPTLDPRREWYDEGRETAQWVLQITGCLAAGALLALLGTAGVVWAIVALVSSV